MGELTEMRVTMDAEAWRAVGRKAQEAAVALLAGGDSVDRMVKAAELLRAVDTFNGHANMMDMSGQENDETIVAAWDLTDEGFPGKVVVAN